MQRGVDFQREVMYVPPDQQSPSLIEVRKRSLMMTRGIEDTFSSKDTMAPRTTTSFPKL